MSESPTPPCRRWIQLSLLVTALIALFAFAIHERKRLESATADLESTLQKCGTPATEQSSQLHDAFLRFLDAAKNDEELRLSLECR
jgi:hypothetical protein